jgi:malate dehydrogenase (oxaloacetate-decarboxylating)(NADP+)
VPDSVRQAYGVERMRFGPEYILPKPFDPRVLVWEATAVARAAMESGVASEPVNLEEYRERLERLLGKAHEVMRLIIHKAKTQPRRVVFPEGENEKVLRAAHILADEEIAQPMLIGNTEVIRAKAADLSLALEEIVIVDPATWPKREAYAQTLYELRQRRGVTLSEAHELINNRNLFGAVMLQLGDADALVGGETQHFPDTVRPALQVIKPRPGLHKVSGLYVLVTRRGDMYFLADCTVNIEPSADDLAEIALCAAEAARRFNVTPRVAMLSFSNFGSTPHPLTEKVRQAVQLVHKADPALMIDGEMMADTAVVPEIIAETYPFSKLREGANVLIFPDLTSANTCYKLLARIGGVETIGPILMGMSKPVHVLQRGAEVEEIVNIAAIAVVDAQETEVRVNGGPGKKSSAVEEETKLQTVHLG